MKDAQLEHWRELCSQIAEEQDPKRFSELVQELLQELERKKQHLNKAVRETAAD